MNKLQSPWWLLVVAMVGAGALIYLYWLGGAFVPNANADKLGQLGDFFGGLLNPLVSILTLFVAISVWRLQKEELELTRNEMAQAKDVMEEQAKTAEQQRREQRFFDLLNLYHSTVQSVAAGLRDGQAGLHVLNGKEAIARLVLDSGFRSLTSGPRDTPTYLSAGQMPKVSEKVQQMGPVLDHYFRIVFTFLREAKAILGNEHYRYVKLFRAQLSRGELEALSLNLIFDPEGKKLRPLIEQYGILKHLQDCQLRRLAEEELHPKSFGHQYAQRHQNVRGENHAA